MDERVDYQGAVLTPLDEEQARAAARTLQGARGPRHRGRFLIFAFVNPAHELRVRELILEVHPEATVSLSHEVFPRWREYDRISTTLADAYLKSLVADYIENVSSGLAEIGLDGNFLIMKSNGGLVDHRAAAAKPVDLIVSGPVGGVLSALYFGQLTGRDNLISMDMGGTSFDVSLIAGGDVKRTAEFEIEWGLPVYTPMVDVRTIGAGGGSIAWIDKGGLLRVGPRSAGANPGPACYGRGGTEPTVTDANLVLGRLNADYFLGGAMALDVAAARAAVDSVGSTLGMSIEETASSIVDLVDFNMVDAIRLVSIDRGLDPRDFTLVSFGGACSLHAGALAEIIGARDVLIPVHQGVFSAFGLMTADMRVDESLTASFRSDLIDLDRVTGIVDRLRTAALERLEREGFRGQPLLEPTVEMRYLGQNYGTDVTLAVSGDRFTPADLEDTIARFEAEHRRLYGYDIPDEIVEFVNFKMSAVGITDPAGDRTAPARVGRSTVKGRRPVYLRGEGWIDADDLRPRAMPAGARLDGPALIEESMSTTLVRPGQSIEVDPYGNLLLGLETKEPKS